jgi:DNA adenine methylase
MTVRPQSTEGIRQAKASPLLKWPGGKRGLLQHILPLVPRSFGKYYEPFLGGAALFFALQPIEAELSDTNADLINCYVQVRDHPYELLTKLGRIKNSESDYYKVRSRVPKDDTSRAARLIYLTALSFNGVHRLNLTGQFNVPYGHRTHLRPADKGRILCASAALATASLRCVDFETAMTRAQAGDLCYLDPPYTVAHGNNGFLKYNDKIFSWEDQTRLAKVAEALADRGCHVIVSNADHPSVRALYRGFRLRRIHRTSLIAASGEFRRPITECLFHNRI